MPSTKHSLTIPDADGKSRTIRIQEKGSQLRVEVDGEQFEFPLSAPKHLTPQREVAPDQTAALVHEVRSPMPGVVTEVLVKSRQKVSRGTPLVTLVAMKMENEICAEGEAVVRKVLVKAGQTVAAGTVLVEMKR